MMKKISPIMLCGLLFTVTACVGASDSKFVLPSGVGVTIEELPFKPEQFNIEGCSNGSYVCRINDGFPFGTVTGLPKSYVKRITVTYKKSSYSLDVSNMYNAWGSRPLEYKGSVRYFGGNCFDAKNCRIRGLFSDAAGSFVAEWVIINGVVSRSILTNSKDVVSLFTKHIDPPVFD